MALYRLHRKDWEERIRAIYGSTATPKSLGKRKASVDDEEGLSSVTVAKKYQKQDQPTTNPGGGRKGISSGLSTVIKRAGEKIKRGRLAPKSPKEGGGKADWWSTLDGVKGDPM